ncbi:MAG: hypothetical protein KAI64_00910 [Thermoplasmata archaeon]|nr:hypothetical protein [Thermoplasmata archaeon]
MKKSILVALVLVSSLFVAAMPANAGGAERPEWQVGDSWSMGNTLDLSQYAQEIQESLDDMDMEGSFNIQGGVGMYVTMKVIDDDATVDDATCYKLSIKGAIGVNMKADVSFSMTMESESMTISGWATATVDVWIDGYIYLTVDEIALKKMDYTLKADLKVEAEMNLAMSGVQQSMSILLEGTNLQIGFVGKFTPAFDLFRFPIVDDEEWTAPNVTTKFQVETSVSGSLRTKMVGGGLDTDTTMSLDELIPNMSETHTIDPEDLFDPRKMTITADKVGDDYNLYIEPQGIGLEDIFDDLPFGDMEMPSMVLVYTPAEQFINGMAYGTTGELMSILEPVTEDEVNTFYANPSGSVPGPGMDLMLIMLIVIIIAVVVVAVGVAAALRRKKPPAAQTLPPGQAPQYPPQPPQQPPQQYPPPPPPPPPPPQQ